MKRNLVPQPPGRAVGRFSTIFFGICILAHAGELFAGEQATDVARSSGAPEKLLPPEELAAWIDGRFDAAWKEQGLEPAPLTNDSEFVRRAFLNLIGRIPSVA